MSNADQQTFWSDEAGASWVALQDQLDTLFQPVLDLVLTHADLKPGMRVLDVGCGTGTSVSQAADLGPSIGGAIDAPAKGFCARISLMLNERPRDK